jgi:hypothetical protein
MPTLSQQTKNDIRGAIPSALAANQVIDGLSTMKLKYVGPSTALTASSTETTFSGATYTIPANTLQIGSVIKIKYQGINTATNSTDTFGVKAYANSTAWITTTATDAVDNDIWAADYEFTVRTIGSSGTIAGFGTQNVPAAAGTAAPVNRILASTTIDTTVDQVITVQGKWSTTSGSNSARLDIMIVEVDL